MFFLRRQDFLRTYLVDQVFSFQDEVRPLFIIGQIGADPLRHNHDETRVSHIHPIASPNKKRPLRTDYWDRQLGQIRRSG